MVSLWGLTDRGLVRRDNQDACAFDAREDYAWAVVCDGMGGAAAGDLASAMAVDRFRNHMLCLEEPEEYQEEGQLMVQATEAANRAVWLKSGTNRALKGMGTTLVGALVKGNDLWVVNVGDSRAYLLREGTLGQVTRDHSVVEDLVRLGDITPEEARRHPQRNLITRALGTGKQVKVDLFQRQVQPGDAILLCSDGLINEVSDGELLAEVTAGGPPEAICRRLLALALERGAPDNVSVVLVQL